MLLEARDRELLASRSSTSHRNASRPSDLVNTSTGFSLTYTETILSLPRERLVPLQVIYRDCEVDSTDPGARVSSC